jgi:hypothetical protein
MWAPSELVDGVLGLLEDAGAPASVNDEVVRLIEAWEAEREKLIESSEIAHQQEPPMPDPTNQDIIDAFRKLLPESGGMVAAIVSAAGDLDLAEIDRAINDLHHAESVGPIIDPTHFARTPRAFEKIDETLDVLRSIRRFVNEIQRFRQVNAARQETANG